MTMARRNGTFGALGLLAVSLVLGACTGSNPGATQDVLGETAGPVGTGAAATGQAGAEADACAAIQTWSDQMRALTEIDPATASVDDVRAQLDAIKTSWQDIKTSLSDVTAADKDAVVQAGDSLETAIDNVSTDEPITQMVDGVKSAADPLKQSYQEMANGLGCTINNPY
jgi:hypothetical protein